MEADRRHTTTGVEDLKSCRQSGLDLAQLIAEQDQLRYQEATLHAPAQVEQQAVQSGMQRTVPVTYVAGQPIAIDLQAPIGAPPTDSTPLWERALAALVNRLGVARDAMAATH